MKQRGDYVHSRKRRLAAMALAVAALAGWLSTARVGWVWMPPSSGGMSASLSNGSVGLYWDTVANDKFGPGLNSLPAHTGLSFDFDYDTSPRRRMEAALWPVPLAATVWAWWSWRRRRAGCCRACGYDVGALGRCPECGAEAERPLAANH